VGPETAAGRLRASAITAARWTTIWVVASKGLHVITTVILARSLAHGEFGSIALLTVILTAGALCQEFGTGASLIYRREGEEEAAGFLLAFQLAAGAVLATLLLAVAGLIAGFFANPVLAPALRVLGLTYLLAPLASVPLARLEKALDYRGKALVDLSGAAVQALATAGLAVAGLGVWSFVWGTLAGKAASAAAVWAGWRRPVSFAFTGRLAREVLGYGRYVFGEIMLWFISVNVDDLLVGRLLGAPALGVYKVGFSTAVMPANSVGALTRVAFPAFARVREDLPLLRRAFLRSTEYCVLLGAPVFALIGVLADPLVATVYGERWAEAAPVLAVLAPYSVLWVAATMVGDLMKAMGAVRAMFWINAGRAVLLVAALLLAVRWGVLGVAFAVLGVAIVTRAVQFHLVARLLGLGAADYARTFGPALGASAAAAALVLALRAALPPLHPVADLGLHSAVGSAAYLLVLWLVSRARLLELVHLVRAAAVGRQG
jgi:PST family polysaccharide transporter